VIWCSHCPSHHPLYPPPVCCQVHPKSWLSQKVAVLRFEPAWWQVVPAATIVYGGVITKTNNLLVAAFVLNVPFHSNPEFGDWHFPGVGWWSRGHPV
jgi:hypothetical protein